MKYFHLIWYYDLYTGEKKELRMLDNLSADWENIGEILGLKTTDITAIRNAGAGKNPLQCLRDVFTRWLDNADNMPSKEHYPCNWTGVYNLLLDSQHSTPAKDLKAAIEASYSDFHHNFNDGELSYKNIKYI